jgi:hypothetical protein
MLTRNGALRNPRGSEIGRTTEHRGPTRTGVSHSRLAQRAVSSEGPGRSDAPIFVIDVVFLVVEDFQQFFFVVGSGSCEHAFIWGCVSDSKRGLRMLDTHGAVRPRRPWLKR